MRIKIHRPVMALAALMVAALACNLGSGSEESRPTPTLFPSLTPSLAAAVTPTPTLTPTLTVTGAALPNSGQVPPTQTNCSPQTGWPVYTVVSGDTLGVIAQRAGSTITQLATANCLSNTELIYVGQKLYVPRLPVTLTPPVANTPFTPQTAIPTGNADAPVITQNLTVQPFWLDTSSRAATYSDTVRISLGEVLNADTVKFYVNDPSSSSPIFVGEDGDPWDGAFVDYAFPEPGSYTFSAIAANDKIQAISSSFTIRYDPNFNPPGGQRNLLTITPYEAFDSGWYDLKIGTTVTITWNDAPRGAIRVDFTLTPTGTNTADLTQTIGSDTNPADGAIITWGVPGGVLGHLQAVATMPDGSQQTSTYANVVSDN